VNDQHTLESILDQVIDDACKVSSKNIGLQFPEPERHEFSKDHQRAMQALFHKERAKIKHKKLLRLMKRIFVLLFVLIVVFIITLFSVQAWRVKFFNFILDEQQKYTNVTFEKTNDNCASASETIFGYIPQGFILKTSEATTNHTFLLYEKDKHYFRLNTFKKCDTISIDTENALVKKFTIKGNEAIFSGKPNSNILLWHTTDYIYLITGNIEEKEIIRIAENLKNK